MGNIYAMRESNVKHVEKMPYFLSSDDIHDLIGGTEREEQQIHDFLVFAMGLVCGIIGAFTVVALS